MTLVAAEFASTEEDHTSLRALRRLVSAFNLPLLAVLRDGKYGAQPSFFDISNNMHRPDGGRHFHGGGRGPQVGQGISIEISHAPRAKQLRYLPETCIKAHSRAL